MALSPYWRMVSLRLKHVKYTLKYLDCVPGILEMTSLSQFPRDCAGMRYYLNPILGEPAEMDGQDWCMTYRAVGRLA
jgi:hypothetical protein